MVTEKAAKTMHKVTFLTVGKICEAVDGETLLEVAIKNDVPLPHSCGGFCACATCHVVVKSGDKNLSAVEEDEEDRLGEASGLTLHSRLGCQARIKGEVAVEIPSSNV